MQGTRWFQSSPLRRRPDYREKAIPIKLFGDGVAVIALGKSWGKTMTALTMAGILNTASSTLSQILLFLTWKKTSTDATLRRAWDIMTWSLATSYDGSFPAQDWTGKAYEPGCAEYDLVGQPLANGFYLTPIALTGDMEFHHEAYKLAHHQSASPCSKCRCNTDPHGRPWTDPKSSAAWRQELWEGATWREEHPHSIKLFHLPTLSIKELYYDIMHCKAFRHWPKFAWILAGFFWSRRRN